MRKRVPIWCLVTFSACTTIEIEEEEIFDVKRTVDAELLAELGVDRRRLTLDTEDGERLVAWHLARPDARGIVVLYGGNGFLMVTARDWIESLSELPVEVLMFDYRGYGRSTGRPSVEGLRRDAIRAYREATEELGWAPQRVVLHGHSLGSFAALYVAERRPAAGVVVENPVTSAEDLVEGLVPWFVDPLIRFELAPAIRSDDNVDRMKRLQRPSLVFGGREDPIAPVGMARTLAGASSWATLRVFEGGSHNDLPRQEGYVSAYRDFIEQVLPKDSDTHGELPSASGTAAAELGP
jgi:uncharacterized protein